MRIIYAVLAESAVALEGKFYIHGGEITRLEVSSMPWSQPLAIAMKIDPESENLVGTHHEIETTVIGPSGEPVAPSARAQFVINEQPRTLADGEPRSMLIAYTAAIAVAEYGPHRIALRLDEHRLELPFAVLPPA